MSELTLLACQIMVPETRDAAARGAHLARSTAAVSAALTRNPADLVVLPELSSIEYSRPAFDALDVLAEPPDGPSFRAWSAVARRHGVSVVYGAPVVWPDGVKITQGVVGPDGALRGAYAKIHTAQFGASMETEFFTRGDGLLTVDVAGFTLAPIICYDIRFPELCRTLCDRGAEVILHCGAYARDLSYYSWRDFAVTRALENQVHLLSLNRAGPGFGGSMFVPPWVDETTPPLQFGDEERLAPLTLSRKDAETARAVYPFRTDRLADYAGLPLIRG